MTPAKPQTVDEGLPGYYDAADEIMHFINALDRAGMDANAVRSAIYHKCLDMRPTLSTPQSVEVGDIVPVAWRWRYVHPGKPKWYHTSEPRASSAASPGFVAVEAEPLYSAATIRQLSADNAKAWRAGFDYGTGLYSSQELPVARESGLAEYLKTGGN